MDFINNMQFSKQQLKILQGVSGGAFGLGILLSLVGAFAFNSENYIHDDKLGMEFGMELDLESKITSVWVRVPQVLHVKTVILDAFKREEDGSYTSGEVGSLFPVNGPTYGAMEIQIEILAADDEQMPDLSTHDQNVIPMAYVRETSKFPLQQRWAMIAFAWAIKRWTMVKLSIYAGAVGMIALGIGLRFRNKTRIEADLVTDMSSKDGVQVIQYTK